MTKGQKLLVDACELENVSRYIARDYCLDFTKLELGQHPAKDPMKHVKAHLETKKNVKGVHMLIGAFMGTFLSGYFGVWDQEVFKLNYYGTGDELWESTTYDPAAQHVAAVANDRNAVGRQYCESIFREMTRATNKLLTITFLSLSPRWSPKHPGNRPKLCRYLRKETPARAPWLAGWSVQQNAGDFPERPIEHCCLYCNVSVVFGHFYLAYVDTCGFQVLSVSLHQRPNVSQKGPG